MFSIANGLWVLFDASSNSSIQYCCLCGYFVLMKHISGHLSCYFANSCGWSSECRNDIRSEYTGGYECANNTSLYVEFSFFNKIPLYDLFCRIKNTNFNFLNSKNNIFRALAISFGVLGVCVLIACCVGGFLLYRLKLRHMIRRRSFTGKIFFYFRQIPLKNVRSRNPHSIKLRTTATAVYRSPAFATDQLFVRALLSAWQLQANPTNATQRWRIYSQLHIFGSG
jgi:hypothetical protein